MMALRCALQNLFCGVRVEDNEYFEHLLMQLQMIKCLNESLDHYDQ
jgi:hypothetical protein